MKPYISNTIEKNNDKVVEHFTAKLPNSLYKFRCLNDFTKNALLKDEIWVSLPTSFNDPYDTMLVFSKNKIKNYIKLKIKNEKRINLFFKYYNCKYKYELVDRIFNDINPLVSRKMFGICSFSKEITNEIMWGHYSNNATGFAIEYDCNNLIKIAKEFENSIFINLIKNRPENVKTMEENFYNSFIKDANSLCPIIYRNFKYNGNSIIKKMVDNLFRCIDFVDSPNYLKDFIIQSYNLVFNIGFKETLIFAKNKDWEYEKEWRLFVNNPYFFTNPDQNYFKIGNLKPTAFYLGEFINNFDRLAILSIAFEKKIKVYQMYTKFYKFKAKLKYKEIIL